MSRESKVELLQRVMYASRASEAAVDRFDGLAADALGVNRTDARCLDIVDNEGGSITAGRLAELSGLTTAAVTAVIDRLAAKGYVLRVRDERDRRLVMVELTDLFRERAGAVWGPLAGEGQRVLDSFTSDQLRAALAWFEVSREANERHAERVRELRFE
jgi:DNA-binding MarR family transcriptional regulator